MPLIIAIRRLKQEDHNLEPSIGCCFKKQRDLSMCRSGRVSGNTERDLLTCRIRRGSRNIGRDLLSCWIRRISRNTEIIYFTAYSFICRFIVCFFFHQEGYILVEHIALDFIRQISIIRSISDMMIRHTMK